MLLLALLVPPEETLKMSKSYRFLLTGLWSELQLSTENLRFGFGQSWCLPSKRSWTLDWVSVSNYLAKLCFSCSMAENGDLESAEPMEQTEVKTETKTEGEEEERTEDYQKLVDYGISEKVANELDEIYKSGEYQLMLSVSEHIAFEEMNILCVTSWSFEALCHLACRYICAFLQ